MRLCLWLILCLFSLPLLAVQDAQIFPASGFQLTNPQKKAKLNPHFKILKESGKRLSLAEVLQQPGKFNWPQGNTTNYSFSAHAIWLHTSLSNVTDITDWVIDIGFPHLQEVEFYLVSKGETVASAEYGQLGSSHQHRFPTFKATLPFATKIDLYIRVKSSSTNLVVPTDIQTQAVHSKQLLTDSILWGVFYGGLLALILFNLYLYTQQKDLGHLTYALFAITLILWRFIWGGHGGLYAPGAWMMFLQQHKSVMLILLSLSIGSFSLSFLNGAKTAPRFSPLIKISMLALILLGIIYFTPLIPANWSDNVIMFACFSVITTAFFAGLESYLNRFKAARLFIIGWGIVSISAFISTLTIMNILPSVSFGAYSFAVGAFLQACFFALALMEKSRDKLQDEVQQVTTDLHNNIELVEEQNVRLDIARKDALNASNVKSQFLANMSHELRTPLNAIMGFSDELRKADLAGEEKEQLMLIHSAADTLLGTVNDVLDFSKIEAGKLSISSEPFALKQLLEEIVTMMSRSAQSKGLEFIVDLSPVPEKVLGDVFRIKQVLNNLLSNAVKFTSHGHIRLSVESHVIEENLCEIHFNVEDTGIGISSADRTKLFTAFSQVDESTNRTYQGTGLGLVISQELLRLMRGRLDLVSQPGQGSCFSIKIPLTPISQHQFPGIQSDWKDKKVALYDPYPPSKKANEKLLTHIGAVIFSTASLRGLSHLNEHYDVLVAALPQTHGIHRHEILPLLNQIRADKRYLVYSGYKPFTQFPSIQDSYDAQIRLPLTHGRLASLHQPSTLSNTQKINQAMHMLPNIHILAVDDMPMNLQLLKTWLSSTNVRLTLAHSGEDAVALCNENPYDLILMDVQMPIMDGVTASQKIRQTDLNIGTPIIAVTAHAFKEEQERLLSSGMDDYLPKPINLPDLLSLIQTWCAADNEEPLDSESIDWDQALSQANQQQDIAEDMLCNLLNQLPDFVADIERLWQQQALAELQAQVHKLHGGCLYTGVPKLQTACELLETALKQQTADQALVNQLLTEAQLLIEEGESLI